jgi:hypothetical protein
LEDRTLLAFISVVVTFTNTTPFTLQLQSANREGEWTTTPPAAVPPGEWSVSPPATIAAHTTVVWGSESNGFLTGTQGDATYQVGGTNATTEVTWDNPFFGTNSYTTTSSPGFHNTFDDATAGGYNANITFTLLQGRASPPGFTPAEIKTDYDFPDDFPGTATPADGQGQTIAVVDAYTDPAIAFDLQQFSQAFGLPQMDGQGGDPTFTAANPFGAGPPPSGYGTIETALDVEWAHAIAPFANILLVYGQSNDAGALDAAANYAAGQPGVSVLSTSFGGDAPLSHDGVTFVSTAGDSSIFQYPQAGPLGVIVGGTVLPGGPDNPVAKAPVTPITGEIAWPSTGGGLFPGGDGNGEPAWQVNKVSAGLDPSGVRAAPDVAWNAEDFPIYDSSDFGTMLPWTSVNGTSAGAPQWAALIAIVNEGRRINNLPALNSGNDPTLPLLYTLPAKDFNDVTTGSNNPANPTPSNSAAPGYDLVTGLGSPDAAGLIGDLWSYDPSHPAFVPTVPSAVAAGVEMPALMPATSAPPGLPGLPGGPALSPQQVIFDGHTYTVTTDGYNAAHNDFDILVSVDGNSPGAPINETAFGTPLEGMPSLAVFNGSLYIAWTGTDNHVNVAQVNVGVDGTPLNDFGKRHLDYTSDGQPALAAFDNALFLAFSGVDGGNDSDRIFLDYINTGLPADDNNNKPNWGPNAVGTGASSPDLAFFLFPLNGQLYLEHLNTQLEMRYDTVNLATKSSQGLTSPPELYGVGLSRAVLYVEGDEDEVGEPDSVVLDTTSSGGVEVTLNGQAVSYPAGQVNAVMILPGGGTNSIQVAGLPQGVSVTVESANNANDSITVGQGTLADVQGKVIVEGNGDDSLTIDDDGDSGGSTAALNASSLDFNGISSLVAWSGLDQLNYDGGGGANHFTVNDTSDIAGGTVLGLGSGSGTVSIGGAGGPLTVVGGGSETVQLTGISSGVAINIDGTGGAMKLAAPAGANTWEISGRDSGTLDGVVTFVAVQNLAGGGSDQFRFLPGGSISGTLDGGGGSATLDYSGLDDPVTVNLTTETATGIGGAFSHITKLVGSASSADTLVGDATWDVNGTNSGSVNGLPFSSFEDLTGGGGADQFVFLPGGSIGNIDGGGGINTLDYSALAGPVTVNLQTSQATDVGGTFANISDLVGSQAGDDVLTGGDAPATWILPDAGEYQSSGRAISFSSFEQLNGGTGGNRFEVVGVPASRVSIKGGSGADVLEGPDGNSAWMITGTDSGTLDGDLAYSDIPNLQGGSAADTFVFLGGSVSGNLDGGPGLDTLDYRAVPVSGPVDLARGLAPFVGGLVSNVERFLLLAYHSPPTSTQLTVTSLVPLAGPVPGLQVQVTGAAGPASGLVLFFDEYRGRLQVLGLLPLDSSGRTTLPVRLPAGTHLLFALYLGDPTHASSLSAPSWLEVPSSRHHAPAGKAASSTPVILETLLAGSAGPATGPVLFLDVAGGVVRFLGTAAADAGGRATLPASLPSGPHELLAVYLGDGTYAATVTTPVSFRAGGAPTEAAVLLPGSVSERTAPGPGSAGQVSLTVGPAGGTRQALAVRVSSSLGPGSGQVLVLDLFRGELRFLGVAGLDALGGAVLSAELPRGSHQILALYLAGDRSGNSESALVPVVV